MEKATQKQAPINTMISLKSVIISANMETQA